MYLLGLIIAYYLINYLAGQRGLKTNKGPFTRGDTSDLLFYLFIGLLVGARLFYILIYNLKFFLAEPLEMLMIWHGGLSFHGGLIGMLIAGFLFCRKRKIDFLELADISVMAIALGLMLGRIGNFINGELVGRVTSVPWAIKFPNYEGFRHPSQLYEAAKNLIIFLILWNVKDKNYFKNKKGGLFVLFILLYSTFRFFIEFFREADPQLGYFYGLTMGQLLNIVMFVIGLVIWKFLVKDRS